MAGNFAAEAEVTQQASNVVLNCDGLFLQQLASCQQREIAAAAAAHRQLGRAGPFDSAAIDAQLARQYEGIERRREALRASLFDLILRGLPAAERDARILAEAAKTGRDGVRAVLAAARPAVAVRRDSARAHCSHRC